MKTPMMMLLLKHDGIIPRHPPLRKTKMLEIKQSFTFEGNTKQELIDFEEFILSKFMREDITTMGNYIVAYALSDDEKEEYICLSSNEWNMTITGLSAQRMFELLEEFKTLEKPIAAEEDEDGNEYLADLGD